MKKHTMIGIVVAAVVFSSGAFAQDQSSAKYDCKSDKVKLNYLMGLRSSNQGLSESAMWQTARIKMLYPDANFEDVKQVADSLTVSGKTPSIRYKAYLASNVFDNPTWFAKRNHVNYEDGDQFFASVAAQLQERILGSRTN